jgi:tRNA dimethylallyltransferase
LTSPESYAARSGERLHVLAGPTASGKTALALRVAEAAGAEILSMDSMLVYRGMDVGTAKPTPQERARTPHHLIDLVAACEEFGVQDWLAQARAARDRVAARGRRALFVGGTAFYLKALCAGLFEGPEPDPALRAELERRHREEGPQLLMAELAAVDPESAARLHANDRKRVVRALEVWLQTGKPLSQWQTQWGGEGAAPLTLVSLAIDRQQLAERIALRTRSMLDAGWVEEVRALQAAGGLGRTARQAVGYSEVVELAAGRATHAETEQLIALRTRQFARKQLTWLRRFEGRVEIEAPRDEADMERAAKETLAALGW